MTHTLKKQVTFELQDLEQSPWRIVFYRVGEEVTISLVWKDKPVENAQVIFTVPVLEMRKVLEDDNSR